MFDSMRNNLWANMFNPITNARNYLRERRSEFELQQFSEKFNKAPLLISFYYQRFFYVEISILKMFISL